MIKVSGTPERAAAVRGPNLRAGRYELYYATLVDLIANAYDVENDRVYGGPPWLGVDHFDIDGLVKGKPSIEALRGMLRALLADRFELSAHPDTKPLPAYYLTAGSKLNLKKAQEPGNSTCPMSIGMPPRQPDMPQTQGPMFVINCRGVTMAELAGQLRYMPMQLNRMPVIDKTGLEGLWDLDFKYAMSNGDGGPSAMEAFEKQTGLKLEPGTAPLPVVNVESANRRPTPDPVGAAEALKSSDPPLEFEVANIKPAAPDFHGMSLRQPPGGLVNFRGVTLRYLMQQAYGVTGDMLAGAPAWFETDRYDLIAKAPASANHIDVSRFALTNRGSLPTVDRELIATMLRAFLRERFKLEVHREDRPMLAYTLLAVKPKMKKADPASRTSVTSKAGPSTGSSQFLQYSFVNTTMAEFAERLRGISFGMFQSPVLDATGLEGGYDFTLSFSPNAMMNGRGGQTFAFSGGVSLSTGGSAPAQAGEASDPSGGITLLEAVEKQLGLKLEKQKRPVSILVIDHIERTPTEN